MKQTTLELTEDENRSHVAFTLYYCQEKKYAEFSEDFI